MLCRLLKGWLLFRFTLLYFISFLGLCCIFFLSLLRLSQFRCFAQFTRPCTHFHARRLCRLHLFQPFLVCVSIIPSFLFLPSSICPTHPPSVTHVAKYTRFATFFIFGLYLNGTIIFSQHVCSGQAFFSRLGGREVSSVSKPITEQTKRPVWYMSLALSASVQP